MPSLTDFNAWLNMAGLSGDQQNPAVMSQMSQQSTPFPLGQESEPPLGNAAPMTKVPKVVPPPPQKVPLTATPTTSPTGSLPQEIVPEQPSTVGQSNEASAPPAQGAGFDNQEMLRRIDALQPNDNSKMIRELSLGEKNYGQNQMLHQVEIDKMKEGLAKYASSDRGTDFSPLAALSDSWWGGNLSAAAKQIAPETEAQKQQHIQEMQSKIANAQGEIPKQELDMLKTKLQQMAYMDERQNKLDIAKLAAEGKLAGSGYQGARLDLQNKRLGLQTDKEARSTANNDPILKQYVPRIEGAAKIGELIESAHQGKVVSNQALLGQLNAEIARLETGSQSPGLGQSEKTELQDAAAQLGSFKDRITGKPSDAVHPEVLDAAGKLVTELSGSYMKGIDSRMKFLKAGMAPQQQAIIDAKHAEIKNTYGPRFGGWRGLQAPGAEDDLNADLTKMTKEQVKAWMAKHGSN